MTFSLTRTPESPFEEFYVWIYQCFWWLRTEERELAHSESPDHEIAAAVSLLNGRKLEEILLHSALTQEGLSHGASLSFAGGLTMKLYPYKDSSPEDEIFMIRDAAQTWRSYDTDGSIRSEPAKDPRDEAPI